LHSTRTYHPKTSHVSYIVEAGNLPEALYLLMASMNAKRTNWK
jgi:hypothetical protein